MLLLRMELDRMIDWIEGFVDKTFQAPPFDQQAASEILAAAVRSEEDHVRLLQYRNGFYALDGLLHLFGACDAPPNHSLRAWNAPDGWRGSWGRLTEGLTFFAEDAFGDQFGYRAGKIVRLRALAGGIEVLHATLLEWIEAVLIEPEYMLNGKLFQACIQRLGALPYGGHFAPAGPLPPGVSLDAEHAMIMPSRDSMELKAVMASRVVRKSSATLRIPKI